MANHDAATKPESMVRREMETVMDALVMLAGDKRMSDACIALGRLGAWAEAGLTPRFAIETLPDPSNTR